MKTAALVFLSILSAFRLSAQNQEPLKTQSIRTNAPARPRALISPEVHRDRTVTFRLNAPNAKTVIVNGPWESPNGKQVQTPVAMVKDTNNIWIATIGPLDPDVYTYSFTVDGLRIPDPGNSWVDVVHPGNNPSLRSVVEIPGDRPWISDIQPVPRGTVHEQHYFSKPRNVWRPLQVYTPPGYETNSSRYAVLYLLHGGLGPNYISLGRMHVMADNLIAHNKAKPMIIVMPELRDFAPDFKDIITITELNYRALPNRENRAINGGSSGGWMAMNIGLEHRDLFAWVGGQSGGFLKAKDLDRLFGSSKSDLKLLWFSCGKDEPGINMAREFSVALKQKNIPHQFTEALGGHTFENGRYRLGEFLTLLFAEEQNR